MYEFCNHLPFAFQLASFSPKDLSEVLDACRSRFEITKDCEVIAVANKADLISQDEIKNIENINSGLICISCSTKHGLEHFIENLQNRLVIL